MTERRSAYLGVEVFPISSRVRVTNYSPFQRTHRDNPCSSCAASAGARVDLASRASTRPAASPGGRATGEVGALSFGPPVQSPAASRPAVRRSLRCPGRSLQSAGNRAQSPARAARRVRPLRSAPGLRASADKQESSRTEESSCRAQPVSYHLPNHRPDTLTPC